MQGRELMCLAEAILVEAQVEHLREMPGAVGRLQTGREDDHLKALLIHPTVGMGILEDQVAISRVLAHGGYATVNVADVVLLPGPPEVGAVFLVERPLLHHEDAAIGVFPQPLFGQHRLFRPVHAAYGGAEGVGLIAGANALQPGDGAWLLPVRGAGDNPFGWAGTAGQPFILHRIHDVGEAPEAKLLQFGRVVNGEAQGKDNRAYFQRKKSGAFSKVDGAGRARLGAQRAIITVGSSIDGVGIGGSPGGYFVSCFAPGHPALVFVRQAHRTDGGADPTIDAAFRVDVAGLPAQGHGEVAGLSFDIHDMCVGQDLDIGVSVVMDIGRGDGRTGAAITVVRGPPAENTIMLRKHKTELRDPPAEAGGMFDEVYAEAGVRQVERSAHPGNASADDKNGSRFAGADRGQRLHIRRVLHKLAPGRKRVGCFACYQPPPGSHTRTRRGRAMFFLPWLTSDPGAWERC